MGSYFGASLAACDVTGDGREELFIGAPLWKGKVGDEGQVTVFQGPAVGGYLCFASIYRNYNGIRSFSIDESTLTFVLKGPIPSLNKLRQDQETKSDNP